MVSRNNYRLPPSHCLNLGLTWTRQKRRGTAVWDVSVYNVYNYMNPTFVFTSLIRTSPSGDYSSEREAVKTQVELSKITILPIIPSIGWTRKF